MEVRVSHSIFNVNYVIALMGFFFLIKWEKVTKARGVSLFLI
jgi:hypothetical protein